MTANPYVLFIPTGTGGTGREAVRDFYANHFLPSIPPDFGLASDQATVLSQLGILNSPVATAGVGVAAKLLKRSTQRG
jgi:hypothetical protein